MPNARGATAERVVDLHVLSERVVRRADIQIDPLIRVGRLGSIWKNDLAEAARSHAVRRIVAEARRRGPLGLGAQVTYGDQQALLEALAFFPREVSKFVIELHPSNDFASSEIGVYVDCRQSPCAVAILVGRIWRAVTELMRRNIFERLLFLVVQSDALSERVFNPAQ